MTSQEMIEAYYKVWLDGDRKKARSFLSPDLKFRSPEDNFDKADKFLDACWKYSENFNHMTIEHSIFDSEGGYVVYISGDLCCGELLKVRDVKIHEIYVTFNPTK